MIVTRIGEEILFLIFGPNNLIHPSQRRKNAALSDTPFPRRWTVIAHMCYRTLLNPVVLEEFLTKPKFRLFIIGEGKQICKHSNR